MILPGRRDLQTRWLLLGLAEQADAIDAPVELLFSDPSDTGADPVAGMHTRATLRKRPVQRTQRPDASVAIGANVGWRAAREETIAFIDSDQRPADGWIDHAIRRSLQSTAVAYGTARPEPDQLEVLAHTPQATSFEVPPLHVLGRIGAVICSRDALVTLGGLDESLPAGAMLDLLQRARKAGLDPAEDPELVSYAAVDDRLLPARARSSWRRRRALRLVRRHPELRRDLTLRVFASPLRARLVIAFLALAVTGRRRWGVGVAAVALLQGSAEPASATGRPRRGGFSGLLKTSLRAGTRAPAVAALEIVDLAAVVRDALVERVLVL